MKNLVYIALVAALFCAGSSARAATLVQPPNDLGLVGYWSFEDATGTKATDFSGNGNTGTLTNMEAGDWTVGKRGSALDFGGTNEYVEVPHSASLNITGTQLTLAAWVKFTDWGAGASGGFISKNEVGIQYLLRKQGTGSLRFCAGGGSCHTITPTAAIVNGVWYHVAGVYDGTDMRIYVDGVLDGTPTGNTANMIENASAEVTIGVVDDPTTLPFIGSIDEARIYNRALGATEVAALYGRGASRVMAGSKTGLVGHWSFDDATGTIATDFSGRGNVGSLSGNPQWESGRRGQALNFDDNGDYVALTQNSGLPLVSLSNPYTIAFWAKGSAQDGIVFSEGHTTGSAIFVIGSNGQSCVRVTILNDANATVLGDCGSNTAFDGQWHHVVFTDSAGTTDLYVDGVLDTGLVDYTPSGSLSFDVSTIGARRAAAVSPSSVFNGLIDDVRIYNRALSSAEVRALYQSTAAVLNASRNSQMTNGLVGLWSFDGPDLRGTTAYDRSGQGNNGTLANSPLPAKGKIGQALNFNGVAVNCEAGDTCPYVGISSTPSSLNLTTMSISFWSKSRLTSGFRRLIGAGVTNSRGFDLYCNGTQLGAVRMAASAETILSNTTTACSDIDWHFIAVTIVGTSVSFYVDGVSVGISSGSWSSSLISYSGDPLRIGTRIDGYHPWEGLLDDVRVYNKDLSATEVLQLYNLGR